MGQTVKVPPCQLVGATVRVITSSLLAALVVLNWLVLILVLAVRSLRSLWSDWCPLLGSTSTSTGTGNVVPVQY